jgi:small nuclear ribonucleoprotein (snRNP)-like protein
MTKIIFPFILTLFLLSGCVIGGDVSKLHVANHPSGDRVTVKLHNNHILYGELLALDEFGIFMLEDPTRKIFRITYPATSNMRVGKARLNHKKGKKPKKSRILTYQNYSRYPQGISDDLLQSLLTAYNQEELLNIE